MASSDTDLGATQAPDVVPPLPRKSGKTKKLKLLKPISRSVDMTSPEAEQQTCNCKDDNLEMSLTIAYLKALTSKPYREVAQSSDEEKFHNRISILGCSTNIEILLARQKCEDCLGIRGHKGREACEYID